MIAAQSDARRASSVRIPAFWTNCRQIAPLLLNKDIELVTRCHIHGACLRPALMYCSETLEEAKTISSFFKSADLKALRRIIGVPFKDRFTNEAVIEMTGLVFRKE